MDEPLSFGWVMPLEETYETINNSDNIEIEAVYENGDRNSWNKWE